MAVFIYSFWWGCKYHQKAGISVIVTFIIREEQSGCCNRLICNGLENNYKAECRMQNQVLREDIRHDDGKYLARNLAKMPGGLATQWKMTAYHASLSGK